jgi:hypothetical protein
MRWAEEEGEVPVTFGIMWRTRLSILVRPGLEHSRCGRTVMTSL